MEFLDLNLYRHPSGVAFDPAAVIEKVKGSFPEAILLPGDQLAKRAEHAESVAGRLGLDTAPIIVETLRRNARAYGPAYAFQIPQPGGKPPIQGLARSVNVQFLFEEPLPEETRNRLIAFLRSLGVGRLEASREGERQSEVLDDLRGESDCVSSRPGVPWDLG